MDVYILIDYYFLTRLSTISIGLRFVYFPFITHILYLKPNYIFTNKPNWSKVKGRQNNNNNYEKEDDFCNIKNRTKTGQAVIWSHKKYIEYKNICFFFYSVWFGLSSPFLLVTMFIWLVFVYTFVNCMIIVTTSFIVCYDVQISNWN